MARSIMTALRNLEDKAERLALRNEKLKSENQALRREVESMRQRLSEVGEERRRALLDAEYLSVSYKLADSPQKLAEARRHLAGLIRVLDRCITRLKEDPKL